MPYTIVSDICEGAADCIPVCPVDCIHWPDTELKNSKGFKVAGGNLFAKTWDLEHAGLAQI